MTFSIEPAGYKCVFIEIDGLTVEVKGHHGLLTVTPVNQDGEKIELKKTRIYQGGVYHDSNDEYKRTPEIKTEMGKISQIIFHSEDLEK